MSGTRPYDLRHGFVSLLMYVGVLAVEVAGQAGQRPAVERNLCHGCHALQLIPGEPVVVLGRVG